MSEQERDQAQTVNAGDKTVLACPILDFLAALRGRRRPNERRPQVECVMLVGQKGSGDNWQLVLKGPQRHDANTQTINEQKENAKNTRRRSRSLRTLSRRTPPPAPAAPTASSRRRWYAEPIAQRK